MRLSIIIPAYNEEERLPATLRSIEQYFAQEHPVDFSLHEVIVVDDGSSDRTHAVAQEWDGRLPLRALRYSPNRGKGAACRTGMLAATGEGCLLYDADGATPIEEIAKFAQALREHRAEVVVGSRVLGARRGIVTMSWHRQFMGRVWHMLTSPLVPGIYDMACGCKLFTAAAAKEVSALQQIDRFAFDVEILAIAHAIGYRIAEVPVIWNAIPGSRVRLVRDTLQMTWSVLKLYVRRPWTLSRKA